MTRIAGLTAVVPAGGAGTRLWPLSRAGSPKYLLDLTGTGRTLLQQTWDRLEPLAGDGVVVVTGAAQVEAVREQLPDLPPAAVIAEPGPRDSMPAIGLAAAILAERDGAAVLGSFAADHVITNTAAFDAAVREAVVAAREGWLVAIAVTPTHPATGFGYLELGDPLGLADAPTARRAAQFVEKPDAATAEAYLRDGGFRWNAGIFVVQAETLLELLRAEHPEMELALREIARAWQGPDQAATLARLWPGIQRIAIDHAVAEPAAVAGRVACVVADLGWDDIGDWASLAALLPAGPAGTPRVLGRREDVLAQGSSGLVVPAGGRQVVVIGMTDVVVVDTPDAVLVMPADHAQQVKDVVAELTRSGRSDLL
jgi:mannose-1-phosphate guanylyltransferase